MPVSPDDAARTLLTRAQSQRRAEARARDQCVKGATDVLSAMRASRIVRRAWIIGSLAWGGFGIRSDIDVVVDAEPEDEALLLRIADEIGDKTGRQVDVLAMSRLPLSFRRRVVSEGCLVT